MRLEDAQKGLERVAGALLDPSRAALARLALGATRPDGRDTATLLSLSRALSNPNHVDRGDDVKDSVFAPVRAELAREVASSGMRFDGDVAVDAARALNTSIICSIDIAFVAARAGGVHMLRRAASVATARSRGKASAVRAHGYDKVWTARIARDAILALSRAALAGAGRVCEAGRRRDGRCARERVGPRSRRRAAAAARAVGLRRRRHRQP